MVDKNILSDSLNYENDLVSIIIPVFNSSNFILETVKSVLNQTYSKIEVIVIDDCSTDNSIEIVQSLNDERIKIIQLSQNSGVAIARNTGINESKGVYIAFLDSDDLWEKDKLEKQLFFMKSNYVGFCYCRIDSIDETGCIIKVHDSIPMKCDYKTLQKNTLIATSTVLIDKSIIGYFLMPNMRSGQDYATWMMLLGNGHIAYGVDEVLVHYRERKNSLSSNKLKSVKQVWNVQVHQQNINRLKASLNIIFFCYNALKKHL